MVCIMPNSEVAAARQHIVTTDGDVVLLARLSKSSLAYSQKGLQLRDDQVFLAALRATRRLG